MLSIFGDIVEKFVEVFMDNLSVFGSSFDNCLENLQNVLRRYEKKNLVLNWEKCHFIGTRGILISHIVLIEGTQVDKEKINLISSLPIPKSTIKDIRTFLGHTGFYRRIIKDFSTISRLLYQLPVKYAPFEWLEKCQAFFEKLKTLLTTVLIL